MTQCAIERNETYTYLTQLLFPQRDALTPESEPKPNNNRQPVDSKCAGLLRMLELKSCESSTNESWNKSNITIINSYRSPRGVEVESGIGEASDRSRVHDDDSAAAENENTKTKLEDVESTPD